MFKSHKEGIAPGVERRKAGRRESDRLLLRQAGELEAARRISDTLFQHADLDQLVEAALRAALDEVGAEAGSILLAEPESKTLIFHYSLGDRPVARGTAIPWDQGIAGRVFQSGEPAIINDVKESSGHYSGIDQATGFVTRDMITLPLKRWKGDPLGVINVLNKRDGRLNEHDLALLSIVSAFAALAIQQARLFEEAKLAEVVHLLGDIGHDLKNLLQPVVSGTWLLKSELDDIFGQWPSSGPEKKRAKRAICEDTLKLLDSASARIAGFLGGRLPVKLNDEVESLLGEVKQGATLLKETLAEALVSSEPFDGDKAKASQAACEEALSMIQRTSERIHGRVKEIADCVKGLSAPPQFAPCPVGAVVDEVFGTLGVLAQEKRITLATKGLDAVPTIFADERRLYNAFYNLVNNAIPEVPNGGAITVTGQFDPQQEVVRVSVADTGRGMPPEVRDRLFSARAISTKKCGTGLGTKIVKDVIDVHHGRISVESEVGVGTVFHLHLPVDPRKSAAAKT